MNIAIDGPAGAGKSTIAKILAQKLKIVYLDTGAMYRAVGLKVYNNGVSADDEPVIERILKDTSVDIVYENGAQKVLLDRTDVSTAIREHHISKYASDVSKIKAVRLKMVELQREIAKKQSSVLDGRDIGTFVLPNAEFKFFLTASIDERAKRRFEELRGKGVDCVLEEIKADIAQRDYNDSHREFAPLKKADDAIEIDTTHLNIDQVAEKMLAIILKR